MTGLEIDSQLLTMSWPALLAAITIGAVIQDDVTCIVVGVLSAGSGLPLLPAVLACFAGTLLGDVAWYFAGSWFGMLCLQRRPIRWVVSAEQLDRARGVLESRGPAALFASRFVPILRTPVQVVAGMLAGKRPTCLLCLTAAAAVYVPLLVGTSMLLSKSFDVQALWTEYGHFAMLCAVAAIWFVLFLVRRLTLPSQ